MTLPTEDTLVEYPGGAVRNSATVLHAEPLRDGRTAVLLDTTSVHPVDAGWPDQGADRAELVHEASAAVPTLDASQAAAGVPAEASVGQPASVPVLDCVVGATDGSALFLGRDIPVPKGTEGWAFVVVHIVAAGAGLAAGDRVSVVVDARARARVSVGHTACHLASLALNRAVADRWKKEQRADALGKPDFDAAAIGVSLIRDGGSTDTYRLGKSLRRKGFITEGFAEALGDVQAAIDASLAEWVATDAAVRIDRDGDRLTDRRYWVCVLPGHSVRIPCGGTHVTSLSELGDVSVALSLADVDGTPVLTMETSSSTS